MALSTILFLKRIGLRLPNCGKLLADESMENAQLDPRNALCRYFQLSRSTDNMTWNVEQMLGNFDSEEKARINASRRSMTPLTSTVERSFS